MSQQTEACIHAQRGATLLIFMLVLVGVLLTGFLSRLNSSSSSLQREQTTQSALLQAKEALIGFAATYRDTHPNQVFGFLPCPDTDNNGESDSCGLTDVSLIGRLPWKTLGLPPLRDNSTNCLWYVVSGRSKSNPKTAAFNWDTLGQLILQDASGSVMTGATPHSLAYATIIAPGTPLNGQTRVPLGTAECGGNNSPTEYLEGIGNLGTANTTVTLANTASIRDGTNNDHALWISEREIFGRVKKRSDFKSDIDALINDLAICLNNILPANLPIASVGNKGIDSIIASCPVADPTKSNVRSNWQDNLLYVGGPSGNFTINGGGTSCRALLFFGGERTTGQVRSSVIEKADFTMYLEGTNATTFPANGNYVGANQYDPANPSADLVRCINGAGSGSSSFDNPTDFSSFAPSGAGVTPDNSTNPAVPKVTIIDAAGSSGGCFWFPSPIPLAGTTVRVYYDFNMLYGDSFALGDSILDRGNGFTLQMVRFDPDIGPPTTCGTEVNMGALATSDIWGSFSFIVETDVRKDSTRSDPTENHTAVLINGNLTHALGTMSSVCNGTTSGCRHSPANKFEESPSPQPHNQRIEIQTGCNPGCSSCNPAGHISPNLYVKVSVWSDCINCSDVVTNIDRLVQPPTIQRCSILNPELNSFYFGFTGGFRSASSVGEAPAQGVTIKNFSLRSD